MQKGKKGGKVIREMYRKAVAMTEGGLGRPLIVLYECVCVAGVRVCC